MVFVDMPLLCISRLLSIRHGLRSEDFALISALETSDFMAGIFPATVIR